VFKVYRAYRVYKVYRAFKVFKDLVLYGVVNGIMLQHMPLMIQFITTEIVGYQYIMIR
jgi:hypothetical protein